MQILSQCSERSPELNTDFECSQSKLEICLKSQQVFTTQKRWRQIVCFC